MVVYNDTFTTNATSLIDFTNGIGAAITQQFLIGNLILVVFALILMMYSWINPRGEVVIVCLLMITTLSTILYFAQMVAAVSIALPFSLFAISLIGYFFME